MSGCCPTAPVRVAEQGWSPALGTVPSATPAGPPALAPAPAPRPQDPASCCSRAAAPWPRPLPTGSRPAALGAAAPGFSLSRREGRAAHTAVQTYADYAIKFLCEFKKFSVDFMTQIGMKILVSTLIVTEIKWLNSR